MNVLIVMGHSQKRYYKPKAEDFNNANKTDNVRIVTWGDQLAGYRADLIIVMDPPPPGSETIREQNMLWYQTVLSCRLAFGGSMIESW